MWLFIMILRNIFDKNIVVQLKKDTILSIAQSPPPLTFKARVLVAFHYIVETPIVKYYMLPLLKLLFQESLPSF